MFSFDQLLEVLEKNQYRAESLEVPFDFLCGTKNVPEIAKPLFSNTLTQDTEKNFYFQFQCGRTTPRRFNLLNNLYYLLPNDGSIYIGSGYMQVNGQHNTITLYKDRLLKLLNALSKSTTIRYLSLKGCFLGDEGASLIANFLKNNKILSALDLTECSIGEKGAIEICHALQHNNVLLELSLKGNRLIQKSTAGVLNLIAKRNALRALDISGNYFDNIAMTILSQFLSRRDCSLEMLALNHITMRLPNSEFDQTLSFLTLTQALAVNSSLQHLELQQNWLLLDEFSSLSTAMIVNKTLRGLSLVQTGLNHLNAAYIREMLSKNKTLSYLNVSNNEALGRNILGVTDKSIHGYIPEWGARRITEGVRKNTGLKIFVMRGCNLNMVVYVANVIKENNTLNHLDVGQNLYQKDNPTILEAIKDNSSLEVITFQNDTLGSAGGPANNAPAQMHEQYENRIYNKIQEKVIQNKEKRLDREMVTTFLQGLHFNIGRDSALYHHFANQKNYDPNLLTMILQFASNNPAFKLSEVMEEQESEQMDLSKETKEEQEAKHTKEKSENASNNSKTTNSTPQSKAKFQVHKRGYSEMQGQDEAIVRFTIPSASQSKTQKTANTNSNSISSETAGSMQIDSGLMGNKREGSEEGGEKGSKRLKTSR